MSLTSTNPMTPTPPTPTRPSHTTPPPPNNRATPLSLSSSGCSSAVADRGIAKVVPKPATVYFDPEDNGRNGWFQFRFAPPSFLNPDFHACFRNRQTYGRWHRFSKEKSVFITGIPKDEAFVQPVMDLCSWKDYLAFQRDVRVLP
jgi:hypothetical protein